MRTGIFFKSIMNGMSMFKAKSGNKRIDCIYLLTDRIDIGCFTMTDDGQWDTGKTGTCTHIKQSSVRSSIDIRKQDKRIQNMKYCCILNI